MLYYANNCIKKLLIYIMKYWPNKQSIELNMEVADLFVKTYHKFSFNLSNLTNIRVPIDLVNEYTKRQLFVSVLIELEILVLDLVELDLSVINIMMLNVKILYDLIYKSMQSFLFRSQCVLKYDCINCNSLYMKFLFIEQRLLLDSLLKYLIFGSSAINENLYPFNNLKTPAKYVALLLDNVVVQISNAIVFCLLYSIKSLPETVDFFVSNNFCNSSYVSIRSIALFKNVLLSNVFMNWYFYYPQNIYSGKHRIWIICSLGLTSKYILVYRLYDSFKLEKLQLLILFCLELQDFLVPKMRNFVVILGKLFLSVMIKVLFGSSKAFIKVFLYFLNKVKY